MCIINLKVHAKIFTQHNNVILVPNIQSLKLSISFDILKHTSAILIWKIIKVLEFHVNKVKLVDSKPIHKINVILNLIKSDKLTLIDFGLNLQINSFSFQLIQLDLIIEEETALLNRRSRIVPNSKQKIILLNLKTLTVSDNTFEIEYA